ncbi:hypothetical protein I4U23_005278 [Adineta vaga]|nr:hypothetical protein I4U23_005278 [Adineta vaga]
MNKPGQGYYQCDISTIEFMVKIILEALQGLPIVLTWLIFVYPSRVYMTEFYMNTWSGKQVAKMLIFLKQSYLVQKRLWTDVNVNASE